MSGFFQRLILTSTFGSLVAAKVLEQTKSSSSTSIFSSSQVMSSYISVQDDSESYDLVIPDGLAEYEDPNSKIFHKPYNHSSFRSSNDSYGGEGSPSQTSSLDYVFNATARNNVVVYFGQTVGSPINLTNLCIDPTIDIVILTFLRYANDPGGLGYPNTTFGASCGSTPTDAMKLYAPGLQYCPNYIPQIQYCQSIGKKIFISIGGSISDVTLHDSTQADYFATKIWDLFGSGTGENPNLRPFGPNVTVDGFDLDNENFDQGSNYGRFATTMRGYFATQTDKTYYLSATCTCTWPEATASIPESYMWQSDFLWIRFYNNLKCNADSDYLFTGNPKSQGDPGGLNYWDNWTNSSGPRIYIGVQGSQSTSSGYSPPDNLAQQILLATQNLTNLGGVMFWDGIRACNTMNLAGNMTFTEVAKAALNQVYS